MAICFVSARSDLENSFVVPNHYSSTELGGRGGGFSKAVKTSGETDQVCLLIEQHEPRVPRAHVVGLLANAQQACGFEMGANHPEGQQEEETVLQSLWMLMDVYKLILLV